MGKKEVKDQPNPWSRLKRRSWRKRREKKSKVNCYPLKIHPNSSSCILQTFAQTHYWPSLTVMKGVTSLYLNILNRDGSFFSQPIGKCSDLDALRAQVLPFRVIPMFYFNASVISDLGLSVSLGKGYSSFTGSGFFHVEQKHY